jgi:transposase
MGIASQANLVMEDLVASRTIVVHLGRCVRRRMVVLSRKTRQAVVLRRCQILLKIDRGQPVAQVAASVGCDRSTVYRTVSAFAAEGEALLAPKRSPGRPPKLKAQDAQALDQTLAKDPRAVGQNFSNWSAGKLAAYWTLPVHATTIWRHLRRLGWRWRRPVRRVASPDPRYGPKKGYLRRLRQAARQGEIYLYFADEMDVALLPTISGCWMRLGQQRQVDTPGQNQTWYVFGAVNVITGELHWVVWERKNNVGFRQLLKAVLAAQAQGPMKVVMVLDRSAYRIHKAKAVGELVHKLKSRLRLYFLPTYSPQLNPIERLWRHCRRNVTDNTFLRSMIRLLAAVQAFLAELACSPETVHSIVA